MHLFHHHGGGADGDAQRDAHHIEGSVNAAEAVERRDVGGVAEGKGAHAGQKQLLLLPGDYKARAEDDIGRRADEQRDKNGEAVGCAHPQPADKAGQHEKQAGRRFDSQRFFAVGFTVKGCVPDAERQARQHQQAKRDIHSGSAAGTAISRGGSRIRRCRSARAAPRRPWAYPPCRLRRASCRARSAHGRCRPWPPAWRRRYWEQSIRP